MIELLIGAAIGAAVSWYRVSRAVRRRGTQRVMRREVYRIQRQINRRAA